MHFGLVTVTILLALAGRSYGRPRDPDPLDNSQEVGSSILDGANKSWSPDTTREERPRELKDIQSMDQSLRTVATQLLNSTKHDDLIRIPEEKIVTIETPMQVVHISTRVENAVSDSNNNNNNNEDDSTKMKFGIPVNSKFGHFEITNPGHAMAMTDEEIEKEMATAIISSKLPPTTPSLLSTWIQLYPISSTTENSNNASQVKLDIQSNNIPLSTGTKLPSSSTVKQTTANTKPIRKTEVKPTTISTERTTESSFTTKAIKNVNSSTTTPNYVKITTTTTTTSIDNDIQETDYTEKKIQQSTTSVSNTTKSPTKKSSNKSSTTPKVKVSSPKNATTKLPKQPNNSSNRVKPFSTRKPTPNKNDTFAGTSKIEKVTLKPFSTLSYNRSETTDKPMFITKIKASLLTDNQKTTTTTTTTTTTPITTKSISSILSKSNFTNLDAFNTKIPSPTRVNNVLKVHLKKPTDDTTKIEIHPIRVNPPVLTIEKIEDISSDHKVDIDDQDILKNSKIDVKFDFNSDVSKVEVQTISPEDAVLSSTLTSSTTKKTRTSTKRKKNKNRRRKTSTTSTTLATTNLAFNDEDSTSIDSLNIDDLQVTGIQESKIEPESKAPPSKKKKPSQQTQIQKPISTQIYNFISREVMPSVGVMSLVGLGLGLASYFLYPFGGVIARRNYDVEPNYKYNIDEYGGNYGLSEEEVLSKVYSGMTKGQHHQDTKYHPGEKNPNYYKYTGLEPQQQQQQPTTRYTSPAIKTHANRVIYRPVETTAYETSYRNSEFKYPDISTTPNYYERQRQQQQTDFVPSAGKPVVGNNRQFVVGNIPKEYSSEEGDKMPDIVTIQDKSDQKLQFQNDESYITDNSEMSAAIIESISNPAAILSKTDEEQQQSDKVFDDMKIIANAAVVEHGPRSLKFNNNFDVVPSELKLTRRKRGILPDLAGSFLPMIKKLQSPRIERSSVIQVIPSKSEIEKEKKEEEEEEDLSNEILDIIDEAVPLKGGHTKKNNGKDHVPAASKQHSKASLKPIKSTSSSSTSISSASAKAETKQAPTTTTTTTTTTSSPTTTEEIPTEPDFVDQGETTLDWRENISTTSAKPDATNGNVDVLGIAKRIFEVKLRLGLTILKHASEGLARYIGHVQKKFNGEQ